MSSNFACSGPGRKLQQCGGIYGEMPLRVADALSIGVKSDSAGLFDSLIQMQSKKKKISTEKDLQGQFAAFSYQSIVICSLNSKMDTLGKRCLK